ncbi:MAG: hypothetical protein NZ529_04480 [Cytophagaceae bacterium]|nr:hypothetical protein [Cytophagaceae bacterium]MDW8456031.1 hypothetical protein [Cytophagaceae bacterium]
MQKKYDIIVETSKNKTLKKEDYYYVARAYSELKQHNKAVETFDLCIKKKLKADSVYFYRGLALRLDKQYNKSAESYKMAIKINPHNQLYYTELANLYYYLYQTDSALINYYKAREQKYQSGECYLRIPAIYHAQENYEKALEEYLLSANAINKQDPAYTEILKQIGLLQYSYKKNYRAAIAAFSELIQLMPEEYNQYPWLIKSYYAKGDYAAGDSLFDILKQKYNSRSLPKEFMESGRITVDEFMWNGRLVTAKKYFNPPVKPGEHFYQFYVLNHENTKVTQVLFTEKVTEVIDGLQHYLCGIDKETNKRYTYPVGWQKDVIDYKSLKGHVFEILDGRMQPMESTKPR